MMNREACDTLTKSALDVAQRKPGAVAFEYVSIRGERSFLTYGNLVDRSLSVAASLLKIARPGDRVLLPCFNESDFHIGFLACLFARCIAVPTHIPRAKKKLPGYGLSRFRHIAENAGASVILAPTLLIERVAPYFKDVDGLRELSVVDISEACLSLPLDENSIASHPDDIAYLQYTSGSTSAPKGVIITHQCIINNQRYMAEKNHLDETMVSVNWLPLYHDMGLSLGCMLGIWLNARTTILSPFAFIANPLLWLQEISGRQNVVAGGPNFCYDHCISKVDAQTLRQLDLSGWALAVNGSEPLIADTLYRFADRFAECGFSFDNFYPAYGMAEATLFVAGGTPHEAPVVRWYDKTLLKRNLATRAAESAGNVRALVGSGTRAAETSIVIVDPQTEQPLQNGHIGEIWISSGSVGRGYWGNAEESKKVFDHRLDTHPGENFFRSGDLGFFDNDELFVTGRIKEVIIIHGANYYPYDIERVIKSAHRELESLMAAAFIRRLEDRELIELAVECPQKCNAEELVPLMDKMRGLISNEFQIRVDNIYLVKIGVIPRTTSGKIQRNLCREKIVSGEIEVIASLCEPVLDFHHTAGQDESRGAKSYEAYC